MPLPTPGSSGGPIVDEENGAVVGVMLGTRMDSRVEGVRGWGVPSETIFEVNLFVTFISSFPSQFNKDVCSTGSGRQEVNYLATMFVCMSEKCLIVFGVLTGRINQ